MKIKCMKKGLNAIDQIKPKISKPYTQQVYHLKFHVDLTIIRWNIYIYI